MQAKYRSVGVLQVAILTGNHISIDHCIDSLSFSRFLTQWRSVQSDHIRTLENLGCSEWNDLRKRRWICCNKKDKSCCCWREFYSLDWSNWVFIMSLHWYTQCIRLCTVSVRPFTRHWSWILLPMMSCIRILAFICTDPLPLARQEPVCLHHLAHNHGSRINWPTEKPSSNPRPAIVGIYPRPPSSS